MVRIFEEFFAQIHPLFPPQTDLETNTRLDDEVGIAKTCCNLSTNARDRGNDEAGEEWLHKTMQIIDKAGCPGRAIEFGKVAEQACEFEIAEGFYRLELDIASRGSNDAHAASSYAYLGRLAGHQGDYTAAKIYYEMALELDEKRGAMKDAAKTCIRLGNLSLAKLGGEPPDFRSAKKWYRKALELDKNATWRDWVSLYCRLWRHRLLGLVSK